MCLAIYFHAIHIYFMKDYEEFLTEQTQDQFLYTFQQLLSQMNVVSRNIKDPTAKQEIFRIFTPFYKQAQQIMPRYLTAPEADVKSPVYKAPVTAVGTTMPNIPT
jgi:deoxyribodipyrimidine photolyase